MSPVMRTSYMLGPQGTCTRKQMTSYSFIKKLLGLARWFKIKALASKPHNLGLIPRAPCGRRWEPTGCSLTSEHMYTQTSDDVRTLFWKVTRNRFFFNRQRTLLYNVTGTRLLCESKRGHRAGETRGWWHRDYDIVMELDCIVPWTRHRWWFSQRGRQGEGTFENQARAPQPYPGISVWKPTAIGETQEM